MIASDYAALEALNENYIRAVRESDTGWFDQYLSQDFLNSNPDGSLVDRAGFLAQIAKPTMVPDLTCEDVQIRILNDIALIHARTAYTKTDGQRGGGRYTDIWMKQSNGSWLCVAAHVTRS
jgi:ketosteroid isomerase-like protein